MTVLDVPFRLGSCMLVPDDGPEPRRCRSAPGRAAPEGQARDGLELIVMHVIADICVTPLSVGVSSSKYVAACVRVLRRAKLNPRLHAYGTNVEGEWERVFEALQKCHRVAHAMGAAHISTTIRLGTRTDRKQTIDEKLRSVYDELGTAANRKRRRNERSRRGAGPAQ